PPPELPPAAADTVRIDIRNLAYTRATITVTAGTVVEWINRDPVAHTVTADNGAFDSGNLDPGARWSRRFDRAGVFAYHCTPHPFMRAVVVVR
ncbi:MAG: cupredoxin domain-containing protein, partial [Longimicrobiales bacterium]